jgi:hypothetical protein
MRVQLRFRVYGRQCTLTVGRGPVYLLRFLSTELPDGENSSGDVVAECDTVSRSDAEYGGVIELLSV